MEHDLIRSAYRRFGTTTIAIFAITGCSPKQPVENFPAKSAQETTAREDKRSTVAGVGESDGQTPGADSTNSGQLTHDTNVRTESNQVKKDLNARGKITVRITGLRNAQGKVIICLYDCMTGFPTDVQAACRTATVIIQNGSASTEFVELPFGTYALSITHDENANGKSDSNFIGMPMEGVGVSNNAKGQFGPPRYEDARFKLDTESVAQEIEITYL